MNTRQGNISHVFTESGKNVYWGHQEETLVGSYSTKVESIVRCLKEIHRKEPQAKSLVFSNWTEVLQILEKALLENSIPYAMLGKSGKFKQNLKLFKVNSVL